MTSTTMRAARMHAVGQPLTIDEVERPRPRPTDVLVEVRACGIVPNLGNVLHHLQEWFPHLYLPKLPAIFGLDATGVVVEKGEQVHGIGIGDRVYVNPARYCGSCRKCRLGETTACRAYAFNGYFGFSPYSQQLFEDYPYGGLAEYMTAPQYSLVVLPDNVSHETAARWGYLGTGYRALRRGGVGPSSTVLINGISGTLGLGVALFALALGARKVLGTARDHDLLARVKAIAPERVEVHSLDDEPSVGEWARSLTDGAGVDVAIDALGPGAPHDSFLSGVDALGRGGHHVNIGAVAGDVPVHLHKIMDIDARLSGSAWFSTAEGQEMADLAESGMVDLSVFEHEVFKLHDVNTALSVLKNRNGGFSNYVICP
ncbi:alcohol dehydrogenase catalytic domain-containing protein [Streptomyces sp. NBC_00582]|uniref:alcohol dehydrogenase catalytic domain-containing protein n=1 Tax=Streptomyces sp. NBC_00582 TaxID=2975783 RepID=UPI0010F114BF|nr:alcohol dehydrogenase catalytic domain-containing protein [Streptomyces sp. NBC_00582]WUB67273.1 alcohol dehydrogenase catalytic domain-containing protein [Streptomyces sp. NBC_00582]